MVLINDVSISCINHASITYHVPVKLILAVMKKENGRNGLAIRNKSGSYDYGVFQINSVWLPKIAYYGYRKEDIQYNACKNTQVAVWIMSQQIAKSKNIWDGIANYHSKTPSYHDSYKMGLQNNYRQLSRIIT